MENQSFKAGRLPCIERQSNPQSDFSLVITSCCEHACQPGAPEIDTSGINQYNRARLP
jgi:hypothetical protein